MLNPYLVLWDVPLFCNNQCHHSPRAETVPPQNLADCLAQSRCSIMPVGWLVSSSVPSLSLGQMKVKMSWCWWCFSVFICHLFLVLQSPLEILLGSGNIKGGAESYHNSERAQLKSFSRVKKQLSPEESAKGGSDGDENRQKKKNKDGKKETGVGNSDSETGDLWTIPSLVPVIQWASWKALFSEKRILFTV